MRKRRSNFGRMLTRVEEEAARLRVGGKHPAFKVSKTTVGITKSVVFLDYDVATEFAASEGGEITVITQEELGATPHEVGNAILHHILKGRSE